ncbi:MAG: DUF928 domain-containing protein [Oscillatoriales cyanobacterium]|nr:MAG: DUF928 domain-containing protein [Oscillatoriales cyanobacterium]
MSDYTTMQHFWSRLVARGTVAMLVCGGLTVPVAPVTAIAAATAPRATSEGNDGEDYVRFPSPVSNGQTANPSLVWQQQSLQQLAQNRPNQQPRRVSGPTLGGGTRLRFPQTQPRSGNVPTIGGGTRGEACFPPSSTTAQEPSLTLLLPLSRDGQSMSANPAVMVFVPTTAVRTAELFVADQAGNVLDRQLVTLTGRPGIIKLPMLSSGKSLQLGKTYNWAFSIICDPIDRSSDLNAIGSVKRVEPSDDVKRALMQARDTLQKAEVLAKAELWYDTLAVAADLKNSQPDQWRSLLDSAKLEAISTASFTELGR